MVLLMAALAAAAKEEAAKKEDGDGVIEMRMHNAKPKKPDEYVCSGFDNVRWTGENGTIYIKEFIPKADVRQVHHLTITLCSKPIPNTKTSFLCPHGANKCAKGDQAKLIFLWARNASSMTLPKEAGFKAGRYIVMQIHYAHASTQPDNTNGLNLRFTREKPRFEAGIFVISSTSSTKYNIPAHKSSHTITIGCKLPAQTPVRFFAYRPHTHDLGRVLSGFRYVPKTGQYENFVWTNPLWPQAFYPLQPYITIQPDERIIVRCTYNSRDRSATTRMGQTNHDEMCVMYMMYFMEKSVEHKPELRCAGGRGIDWHSIGQLKKFDKLPSWKKAPLSEAASQLSEASTLPQTNLSRFDVIFSELGSLRKSTNDLKISDKWLIGAIVAVVLFNPLFLVCCLVYCCKKKNPDDALDRLITK